MRIDLPGCSFKNCKYNFDCNCTNKSVEYERCEFNLIIQVIGDDYNLNCIKEALKKQEEYEQFMKKWEKVVELAGMIKMVGAKRLSELVEADQEGRCVVLPCKVGDTVYIPDRNNMKVLKKEVHQVSFNHYGDQLVFAGCIVINVKKFGETVFLTPEEAQASLERMKSNG